MIRIKLWKESFRCLPECLKPSLVMPDSQIVRKNKMNRKEKGTCLRSVARQGKDIIWFYIDWIFYNVNQGPFSQIHMNQCLLNSTEPHIEGFPDEVLLITLLINLERDDKKKLEAYWQWRTSSNCRAFCCWPVAFAKSKTTIKVKQICNIRIMYVCNY